MIEAPAARARPTPSSRARRPLRRSIARYIHIRVANHQLTKLWRNVESPPSQLELATRPNREKKQSADGAAIGVDRYAPDFRLTGAAPEA
jgi:hypothetical protein